MLRHRNKYNRQYPGGLRYDNWLTTTLWHSFHSQSQHRRTKNFVNQTYFDMSAKFIITMNRAQLLTWGGYWRLFPDGSHCLHYSHTRYSPPFLATISSNRAHLPSLQCSTIRHHSPATLCEQQYLDMYYLWKQRRQDEMEMVLKLMKILSTLNNVVELSKIPMTFTCFIEFGNFPTIAITNFN